MLPLRLTRRLFHISPIATQASQQQLLHKVCGRYLSTNMASNGVPEKPIEKAMIKKLTEEYRVSSCKLYPTLRMDVTS